MQLNLSKTLRASKKPCTLLFLGAGHVDDLFPYFLRHARQAFPHLDCLDDLKKISDLRTPANWFVLIFIYFFIFSKFYLHKVKYQLYASINRVDFRMANILDKFI